MYKLMKSCPIVLMQTCLRLGLVCDEEKLVFVFSYKSHQVASNNITCNGGEGCCGIAKGGVWYKFYGFLLFFLFFIALYGFSRFYRMLWRQWRLWPRLRLHGSLGGFFGVGGFWVVGVGVSHGKIKSNQIMGAMAGIWNLNKCISSWIFTLGVWDKQLRIRVWPHWRGPWALGWGWWLLYQVKLYLLLFKSRNISEGGADQETCAPMARYTCTPIIWFKSIDTILYFASIRGFWKYPRAFVTRITTV